MRSFLLLLFILFTGIIFCAESPDSTRSRLVANATFSIETNGFSPIPAFSLGKPAVSASISLAKGRFSFDPTLAYGLDMKPWYLDSWLHYLIIDKPVFKLRTGLNFSNFFTTTMTPGGEILQGVRYWTGELAGIYCFSQNSNVTLRYWTDNGQDHGTLTGHFLSLSGEKSGMRIGDHFECSAYAQLFYISYNGPNDGLFISPRIAFSAKDVNITIFGQFNQPIITDITPYPGFMWSVGLAYSFK